MVAASSSQSGRRRPSTSGPRRPSTYSSQYRRHRRTTSGPRRPSTYSSQYRRRRRSTSDPSDWVMLDGLVPRRKLVNATTASSRTSTGLDVSVSLSLATPPASSSVYVHIRQVPAAPTSEMQDLHKASTVVAADAGLLLLLIAVPAEAECRRQMYPYEYFVYRADPLGSLLKRLPDLGNKWMRLPGDAGVACRGEQFVVAVFHTFCGKGPDGRYREVAKLARFSSARDEYEWEVKELAMPHDADKGLKPFRWENDAVFSFAGGTVCWVDYKLGLLLCNVFDEMPELRFVPLPVRIMKLDRNLDVADHHGGLIQSYRTVGVDGDGVVKFVEVNNRRHRKSGSIATWTLRVPRMVWDKDAMLNLDYLQTDFEDAHLPLSVPEFPTVSRQDADELHFILQSRRRRFAGKVWVITINMRTKRLESCTRYKGLFADSAFLYSGVSKYLHVPSGGGLAPRRRR